MELKKLLFSFKGRIGRITYWLAILALIAGVLICTFAPFELANEEMAILIVAFTSQFIWLVSLWPILAVGSKRLHDRNKSGWWLLVFWVLPFLLYSFGFSIDFFDDPANVQRSGYASTGSLLVYASLPLALWGFVELGILPGTKGPNTYGADPSQQQA